MTDVTAAKVIIPVDTNAGAASVQFDKLDASLNKVDKSSTDVAGTAGKMKVGLAAVGIAAGAAMVSMVSGALKGAAALEQNEIALTTMLKSADKAKALLAEWRDFGASTPFETDEIIKAGKQLVAFGESATTVTATLKRIGDVAAGVGVPLGALSEIYGKIRVSQTVYNEDLNQLAGRGIPIFTELEKVMGKNAAQIKKMSSEGKIGFKEIEQAFKNMTSNGGTFAGLMEAQSKSLGGLYSTLKSQLSEMATEVGGKLAPAFKDLLTTLTSSQIVLPAIKTLFYGVASVINGFVTAINWAIGAVENLGKTLKAIDRTKEIATIQAEINALQKSREAFLASADGAGRYAANMNQLKIIITDLKIQQAKYTLEQTKEARSGLNATIVKQLAGRTAARNAMDLTAKSSERLSKAFEIEDMGVKKTIRTRENATRVVLGFTHGIKANRAENEKLYKIESEAKQQLKLLTVERQRLMGVDTSAGPVIKKNIEYTEGQVKAYKKLREELLGYMSAAGSLPAQLELLKTKYEEQAAALKKAGFSQKDLALLEKFYLKQRQSATDAHTEKELSTYKAFYDKLAGYASAWGGQVVSVLSAIQAFNSAVNKAQIDEIDARMNAEMKAMGVLEETQTEQAQKEYNAAVSQGDAVVIAEKDAALKRAQIAEKYAAEKAALEYKGAHDSWAMSVAMAAANVPLAVLNAIAAGAVFGPAGMAAFGAAAATAAGLQVAAIAAAEPKPPAAQMGGSFIVPPGNQADSGLLRVNQGEKIDVTPVSKSGTNSGAMIVKIGERDFRAYITDEMNRIANSGDFLITRRGVVKTA